MLPYLTLFAWSFLAATVLPLGSEPAVVVLVRQNYSIPGIVITATIGNYLGACTTYAIGRGAAAALRNRSGNSHDSRATRLITTHGAPALVLSWVPIIGDAIVAAAGVAKLPVLRFSLWTIGGKLFRYIVVAWLAWT